MKTHLSTQSLLSVVLCILALGCRVWAGGGFLDDFSDGSIQDDSPVTWQWNADRGQYAVTPEGLQLRPSRSTPHSAETWLVASVQINGTDVQHTGDVSIRAQLNIGSGDQARACVSLRGSGTNVLNGGYIFVITGETFFFAHADGFFLPGWESSREGSYDPEEDVIIQLDAIDITDAQETRTSTRLEGRWWMPGQQMPVGPQIVVIDDTYASGGFGIGAATNEPSSPSSIVFRWVEVTCKPIVDFNGNGTVDMKDLLTLIDSWGQDEASVDIVPDGVVDAQDLEVLMDHWQREVNDPTLLANWKLDETEGTFTMDSVNENQGIVLGNPVWQPESGQVQGCLAFDGIDDMIVGDCMINPEEGPFSVFTWIKGGAPGQVILSQQGGDNWLQVGVDGTLMTGLTTSDGRIPGASLYSQTVVTDGNWHRIGFVWDGAQRVLYVDDVPVVLDSQTDLVGSTGALVIGAGTDSQPGTFWSGMIDDVRVYNRAIAMDN